MAKRKNRKVTVASVKSAHTERTPEMRATNERVRHSRGSRIGADGVQRLTQSPLDWCASNGKLFPGKSADDQRMNAILWDAGKKLERAWHSSGLTGVGAMDFSREGSGGDSSPAWAMPTSEYAVHQRSLVRRADKALRENLGKLYASIVFSVVIDEERIEDVAPVGYNDRTIKIAFGMEFLRVGLYILAKEFCLLPDNDRNISVPRAAKPKLPLASDRIASVNK